MMDLAGKNITVLGLSKSGASAVKLLLTKKADVFVSEKNDTLEIRENIRKLGLDKSRFELGKHSQEFIKNKDFIIVSPGIDDSAEPIIWAKQFNIPIFSEIELGFWFCPAKIIAITGSNGKTTVTTLISKVLNAAGLNTYLLGNIGRPFCEDVLSMTDKDFVSLEVSSFQLERIKYFKPHISIILNIAINHMDRHKNIQEYVRAKKRIFINQDSYDWAILNYKDEYLRSMESEIKSKIIYFNNRDSSINPNFDCIMKVANILAIKDEIAFGVLNNFKGLEHRIEEIKVINGVRFINDSKSTNVASTIWALNLIKNPIILIAGGRDKGDDFTLLNQFDKVIKHLVLFGEARDKIADSIDSSRISKTCTQDLQDAIGAAFNLSEKGDCILFSPMCTSFDMFKNYEERGERFKQYVQCL
ncbi:MAG: Mur ligase family protein [Candidatus Omnitrophota bacterium]